MAGLYNGRYIPPKLNMRTKVPTTEKQCNKLPPTLTQLPLLQTPAGTSGEPDSPPSWPPIGYFTEAQKALFWTSILSLLPGYRDICSLI